MLSVFSSHPVIKHTMTRIAESTVEHVTVEMHKMLTISMEEAIVAITASAMKYISTQMEQTVLDIVGCAAASPSVIEAEFLHITKGWGGYGGSGYGGGFMQTVDMQLVLVDMETEHTTRVVAAAAKFTLLKATQATPLKPVQPTVLKAAQLTPLRVAQLTLAQLSLTTCARALPSQCRCSARHKMLMLRRQLTIMQYPSSTILSGVRLTNELTSLPYSVPFEYANSSIFYSSQCPEPKTI
jgi:hypothetical protein